MKRKLLNSDFEFLNKCPLCSSNNISCKFNKINKVKFLDIEQDFNIFNCSGCNNAFLNPQPKSNIISNLYPKKYFEYYKKNLISLVNPMGNKKYLEIGPGDGTHLQKIINSKDYSEIWIVDVTKNGFNLKKNNVNNLVKFIQNNIDSVHLPKNYFDTIYMSHVIEHTIDPIKVISKMYNSLNTGGKIFINTPNFNCLSNKVLSNKADFSCPNHLYFFTIEGFGFILKKAKINNYHISTHWGNMLANTLTKNLLVKILLSPFSIGFEYLFNLKDNIELIIEK